MQRPAPGQPAEAVAQPVDPASDHAAIDCLIVGHVCWDETPSGRRIGGTAAYAARALQGLGRRPGVVTSAADELDLGVALPGVAIHRVPAAETTCFRHYAADNGRGLLLLSRAAPLRLDDVPPVWRTASLVHLAPIAAEVDPALAMALRAEGCFVGATVQGWLRQWDEAGHITPLAVAELPFLLGRVDALAASSEDLAAEPWGVSLLAAASPLVALTLGDRGVAVYDRGKGQTVPACPALARDTTGAGDVFASVWFARLAGGRAPVAAARYAAAAAACTVEQAGIAGVPAAAEIEERLAAWAQLSR